MTSEILIDKVKTLIFKEKLHVFLNPIFYMKVFLFLSQVYFRKYFCYFKKANIDQIFFLKY